jgi:CRP-like cAMP-binding protein
MNITAGGGSSSDSDTQLWGQFLLSKPTGNPYRTIVSPPELLGELKPLGHEIACAKGTVLFREGDVAKGVYIMLRGHASLTMITEKGETVLVRSSGPGSLLGLPGTFLRGIYQLTATIDQDARLIFIERQKVLEFLRRRTDVCMLVLHVLGMEVSQMPIHPGRRKRRPPERR